MLEALLKKLDEMGKGDSVKEVMLKAIRETAAWTKTSIYEETKAKYTIKSNSFRKSDIKVKNASKTHLEAFLTVQGGPLSVRKAYRSRKNGKRKGASILIKNSSSMKELTLNANGRLYKAFLAEMSSGHQGIFQRDPDKTMKSKPNREAINEIFSLSRSKAAEMAYKERVHVTSELYYQLHKHMNAIIGG